MKKEILKIAVMALISALMFIAVPETASAQFSKKQEKKLVKENEKMYKNKIKEYQKEGWKLAGGSRTLEVALLAHYKKLTDVKNKEFIGDVSQCKSINVCRQAALNNAQNRYASLASGNIKGRVESLFRADANMPETEIDKVIGAYEKSVQADISGSLVESYSIVKENGNGTKSFQTIFIINEEEAASARMRAMERSLKETKISIMEAEEISKFVNEGFNLE
ncbi:MAG: hypothetical protein LBJ63_05950 [Prevotellaceae bacterium]|jgi:type II secretory pathway pseudopilin PulG|nr:hypothetical protein [Prevotellaceae bacterium]